MSKWLPIETPTNDFDVVRIKTLGGHEFDASFQPGFVDDDGLDCWCWVAVNPEDAPDCWTDGICWGINDDLKESDQPTHWVSLPDKPEPVPQKETLRDTVDKIRALDIDWPKDVLQKMREFEEKDSPENAE